MLNYNEFTNTSKLEEKSNTYDFGCSMVYFPCPELEKIQEKINPDDLYTEDGDGYGIENENYPPIVLENASLFESENYDVLKFDANCPKLHDVNKALSKLPHTTSFPDYHPHATVAYLKKGKGADYASQLEDIKFSVTPNKIVYSKPDGSKSEQALNQ